MYIVFSIILFLFIPLYYHLYYVNLITIRSFHMFYEVPHNDYILVRELRHLWALG